MKKQLLQLIIKALHTYSNSNVIIKNKKSFYFELVGIMQETESIYLNQYFDQFDLEKLIKKNSDLLNLSNKIFLEKIQRGKP